MGRLRWKLAAVLVCAGCGGADSSKPPPTGEVTAPQNTQGADPSDASTMESGASASLPSSGSPADVVDTTRLGPRCDGDRPRCGVGWSCAFLPNGYEEAYCVPQPPCSIVTCPKCSVSESYPIRLTCDFE